MTSYDIAAKVLIDTCREEILRRFLGIPVSASTLLEDIPQETSSLRRSDFPLLVTDEQGGQTLVLLEVQSEWEPRFPLRLLEYRSRHMLRHGVDAITCVLLLRPSKSANDHYQDREVDYHFRLVRIYEMDAAAVLSEQAYCLLPMVPLMRGGVALTEAADRMLYQSLLPEDRKSDMLTTMTILSGLVSDDLPQLLVSRRRDLMIQSAAYDIIKREGIQEGWRQGLEHGLEQGLERGLEQGLEQGLERGRTLGIEQGRQMERAKIERDILLQAITFGLDIRFSDQGLRLLPEISRIEDTAMLRAIMQRLRTVSAAEDLRALYLPDSSQSPHVRN